MQDEKGASLRAKLNMTVTAKLFCLQILTALLFVLYPPPLLLHFIFVHYFCGFFNLLYYFFNAGTVATQMVWVVECIISLVTIEFVLAIYCACVTGVMLLGFYAAWKHLRHLLFCVRDRACRACVVSSRS